MEEATDLLEGDRPIEKPIVLSALGEGLKVVGRPGAVAGVLTDPPAWVSPSTIMCGQSFLSRL
jgi:hypothetical protein